MQHLIELKAYLEKHREALSDNVGYIEDCISDIEFDIRKEIENRPIMDQIVFTSEGDRI